MLDAHRRSLQLTLAWPCVALLLGSGCPSDSDDDETTTTIGQTSTTTGPGQTATSGQATTSDGTGADSTTADSGVIMNECGTFDTNEPGDSVPPQDPADPDITTACTALCDALGTVPDCQTDAAACLETCRLRSCDICPGTLAPLVTCEAESFDAMACECGADGAACPIPAACEELAAETGFCGG